MDKKLFKSLILLATFCILLVAFIVKIDWVIGFICTVFILLSPLLIGIIIAFVVNPVYEFFVKLFSGEVIKRKKKPVRKKTSKRSSMRRMPRDSFIKLLAVVCSYAMFLALISLILLLFIPQLIASGKLFVDNFSGYLTNLEELFNTVTGYFHIQSNFFATIEELLNKFVGNFSQFATGIVPHIFDVTKNVASSIGNIVFGFIMSVYMIGNKDKLLSQLRSVSHAFLPQKFYKKFSEIMKLIIRIFSSFITGRFVDSVIVGVLCFILMKIFGFAYPMLISVIIGVTNVIPVFGPFMGAIPSAFILLMVDPMQAIYFSIMILVLQQIDGNIIDPRIVGNSIGLPPMWSMLAIFVGGGLFGIFGMLIGVPIFAVVYSIVQQETGKRLKAKREKADSGGGSVS